MKRTTRDIPYEPVDKDCPASERFIIVSGVGGTPRIIDRFTGFYVYTNQYRALPFVKMLQELLVEKPTYWHYKLIRRGRWPMLDVYMDRFMTSERNDSFIRTGDYRVNYELWWGYFLGEYDLEEYQRRALVKKEERVSKSVR